MNQKQREYYLNSQARYESFVRDKEQWTKELIAIGLSESDAYTFSGCILPDVNRLRFSKESILKGRAAKGFYDAYEFLNNLSVDVLEQIFELYFNESEMERIKADVFNEKLLAFCNSNNFDIEVSNGDRIVLVKQ